MKKTNFFKISILSLLLCVTMTSVYACGITCTFENLKEFHKIGYIVLKGNWISLESLRAYKKNYGLFGSIDNSKYDYKYNYS
ncbi:hypothetical protein [Thomasclavelia cocleata]|uniref:hypothetical protein n=1 Tax=Thomasclavelia cocleata TaxID=69824 RepID=UPI00242EA36A|nr:hypothetical protein [Thomasclavelia cocleata]